MVQILRNIGEHRSPVNNLNACCQKAYGGTRCHSKTTRFKCKRALFRKGEKLSARRHTSPIRPEISYISTTQILRIIGEHRSPGKNLNACCQKAYGGTRNRQCERKSQHDVQDWRKVICPQTHFTDPNRDSLSFDVIHTDRNRRTSFA
jgi:hypothetical protein